MQCIRILLSIAFALVAGASQAQPYPTRPITLVVPFAPGGSNDIIARVIGERLQKSLGQSVVVENQSGAGGSIGIARVAKSEPDGYTLVVISITFTINAVLQAKPLYDAMTSFEPVALIGRSPMVLATSPAVPVKTPAEFLALARANPGKLNYGSAGNGSINQIAAEVLKSDASINLTHVPYRGVAPALNDLIAGHVQLIIASLPAMMTQMRADKVNGIAVTTKSRSKLLPDVPTLDESIAPGYDLYQWWGFLAPAGTPAAIVAKLNASINATLESEEVQTILAREGAETAPSAPATLTTMISDEVARWRKLVSEGRLKPE